MRIRSIKPEFWRSLDVARLPRDLRLLFIGLWSYVDDNGVGIDDYRQVAADLFALEDDPREAREYVRDGLASLAAHGLIARYACGGRAYLFVTGWRHQKVDRPATPRYPQPSDPDATPQPPTPTSENVSARDNLATTSRECRDNLAPVTGEQGNRGTGEQVVPPSAGTLALVPPPSTPPVSAETTAQALVGEWIDHCRKRPPGSVIGQVGKQIKAMLAEGIDPEDIRSGLAAWWRKGLHPSVLPAVVNESMNAQPADLRAAPVARPSTTDQRVAQAREVGRRLQARLDAQEITA